MSKELTTTNTTAVSAPAISIPQMEKLNPKRGIKLTSPALQSAYNQMCEAYDAASKEVNAAGNVALTARERLNLKYEEILCSLPFTPKGKLDPERMGGVKSVSDFAKAIEIPASTAYALLAHGRLMRSDAPDSIKAFPRSNYDAVKAVPLNDLVNAVKAGEISAETPQEDLRKWKASYDARMGRAKPAKVVTTLDIATISPTTGEAHPVDTAPVTDEEAFKTISESGECIKLPAIKTSEGVSIRRWLLINSSGYTLLTGTPHKAPPKSEPLSAMETRANELRKTLAAAGMADEAVKAAVEAAFPTVQYDKLK